MKKVYLVTLMNDKNREISDYIIAEDQEELDESIRDLIDDPHTLNVIDTVECGDLQYQVCAIGYDKNNIVTDYVKNFGSFDTEDEAYVCYYSVLSESEYPSFFDNDGLELGYLSVELGAYYDNNIESVCIDIVENENVYYPQY